MDDPKGRKASRDGEHTACLHTTILDWFLCQHKKESNWYRVSNLMITEKVWKETAQLRLFAITDAKDCFWSKANDFHSCSIKSSKLEPFSVLDIQSVLNLMQFLHTHRNMHSVFLWKSRPVNMKQPLQKNCFPKNFSQRWSN